VVIPPIFSESAHRTGEEEEKKKEKESKRKREKKKEKKKERRTQKEVRTGGTVPWFLLKLLTEET
jgi:hypothetical protein